VPQAQADSRRHAKLLIDRRDPAGSRRVDSHRTPPPCRSSLRRSEAGEVWWKPRSLTTGH
jgi:hypothetical protein